MDQTSTTYNPCVGLPIKVTMPEKNRKILQNHLADSRMKVGEVAETVGIIPARVLNILHEHLCMTKSCELDECRVS